MHPRWALWCLLGVAGCAWPRPRSSVAPAGTATGGAPGRPSCRVTWTRLPLSMTEYTPGVATGADTSSEAYARWAAPLARDTCDKEWTVLLYMAADNDLAPAAYWQLHQIEGAPDPGQPSSASTRDADVLVELDVDRPVGVRRLHLWPAPLPPPAEERPTEGAVSRVLASPVVETLVEAPEPPEQRLERFVRWGLTHYPARHTWIVVWGHGAGWRPQATATGEVVAFSQDIKKSGIAPDYTDNSVLDIPSLRAALTAAIRPQGSQLDVLALDACLMQSVEVGAELVGTTRYMVGSEQVESYLGLPYRLLLPHVNGNVPWPRLPETVCQTRDAACHLAYLIPTVAAASLDPGGPYGAIVEHASEHYTFSSVDEASVATRLEPALRRLSAALLVWLDEEPLRAVALEDVLATPRGPGRSAARRTPDFQGSMRDLGVVLDRFARVEADERERNAGDGPAGVQLRSTLADARAAVDATVLVKRLGSRYSEPSWHGTAGVSIWVPFDQDDYRRRIDGFAVARLYAAPAARATQERSWRDWLDRLFSY